MVFKRLLWCLFLLFSACAEREDVSVNTVVITSISDSKTTSTKVDLNDDFIVEKNLWHYIAKRYTLPKPTGKELFWHIDWFKKNPDYLTRVTKRANPYLHLVTKEVERAGLPIEIALLPIVESAYYPFSYSHGSASGLWQFIPDTGKLYGLKKDWWYDGRRDVLASTNAAVNYLKNLNILFKGDWLLAIAAYNSGPGRVQRAIQKNKKRGKLTDFWHLDLPIETRGYVPRLLAVAELIKYPKLYGQTISEVKNKPILQAVILNSQLDLALIAKWSELDLSLLYDLNPGIKRWTTPDSDYYQLLLPIDKVAQFKQQLAKYPKQNRVKWVRHKINNGDSLSLIARKYKTTTKQIKNVNKLNDHCIRAGDYLIVPVAQKSVKHYVLSDEQRKQQRMNTHKSSVKMVYTVVSGDSLWGIAKKYKVSINNIVKWNQINRLKPLRIGQALVLYKSKKTANNLSLITNIGIDIDRKIIYTVRAGDNLSSIAKKFKMSLNQLKLLNNINDKKPLQIGKKLNIIVNVVNFKMK